MKNLKKLMSVVLCVAMLMSFVVSTSAATFTDVEESNAAYSAVEVLSALDILTGRDDGSFDPEADIKRSEFAAVVCRAMNQEATATGATGFTNFTDVAIDHWAVGYINWAAQAGIVNGKGAGIFDPDAPVTYQEAVKMLVCALGFGPYAEIKGGYPTGYMAIGANYGITNGVAMSPATGNATRAGVAQLTYNTLDAPLMDAAFITLGDDAEYTIYDGGKAADGEKRTLLSQYRDMYKVKATVKATFKTDSDLITKAGNMVELSISNTYKFDEFLNDEFDVNDTPEVIVENAAYADYLGYTVNAYVYENEDGDYVAAAMIPDMKSAEVLEFANAREEITDAAVVGGELIVYYEENNREVEAEFVDDLDDIELYINGKSAGAVGDDSAGAVAEILGASKVVLMGEKSEGVFSKIFVTKYEYGIVEEVDTETEIITTDVTDYMLAEEDNVDDFSYVIYKDGEEITLADVAEGDLLNVIVGQVASEDPTFYEIYVTNNVIESSVSERVPLDGGGYSYIIDGDEYFVAPGAGLTLSAVDAGKFFITIDGYLYDADISSSYSDNYAFIIAVDDVTAGSFSTVPTWQIKVLTKNNEIKVLDVKTSLRVVENGVRTTYEAKAGATNAQADFFGTLDDSYTNADPAVVEAALYNRVIIYKESNGLVTDITFPYSTTDEDQFGYSALAAAGNNYKASTARLEGKNVVESSVLFVTPVTEISTGVYGVDENKVQVYAASGLSEDVTYAGYVYNVVDRTIGAALLYNDMGFAGKADAMAVLRSITEGSDANGEPASIANFFQAGEMKSVVIDADYTLAYDKGDVFHYTVNGAGELNEAVLVYDYSASELQAGLDTADYTYAMGVVSDKDNVSIALVNDDAAYDLGWALEEGGTNVMITTRKMSNMTNAVKAQTGTSYIRAYKEKVMTVSSVDYDVFNSDVYVVVAKVAEGDVAEVVAYLYDNIASDITVEVDDFIASFTEA